MTELMETYNDFKLFLSHWHLENRQRCSQGQVRFPYLNRLLNVHFGIPDEKPTKAVNKSHKLRRGLGKSQTVSPQASRLASMRETESRLEKQLRKAVEAYRAIDFFKAIWCFRKVSCHLLRLCLPQQIIKLSSR